MLSSVCRLALTSPSGEDSSKELVPKLQLCYEDSETISGSAGLSFQVSEKSLRVCKFESKIARKEIKRVAASEQAILRCATGPVRGIRFRGDTLT